MYGLSNFELPSCLDEVNAFVLPGGKVFVCSGIFNLTRNEAGMATVLGHEMSHGLANHFGEKMSETLVVTVLVGSLIMLSFVGALAIGLFLNPLLKVVFTAPMSRIQESEVSRKLLNHHYSLYHLHSQLLP